MAMDKALSLRLDVLWRTKTAVSSLAPLEVWVWHDGGAAVGPGQVTAV